MNRQKWFQNKRWGFFTHYLAGTAGNGQGNTLSAEDWNDRIDAFDIPKLVEQLRDCAPDYVCITIGQNSGHYLAPNAVYDRLTGIAPSKCSRRDLAADLAQALEGTGIDLLVYLPSGAPCADEEAVQALEWQDNPTSWNNVTTQDRLISFQRKWEAVIREWSMRWRHRVKGWWIDGCYFPDIMYHFEDEPNYKSFTDAIRAGNPEAVVALNSGTQTPFILQSEYDDYTAGEVAWDLPLAIDGRADRAYLDERLGGRQLHVLSFLGDSWSQGHPRFPVELAVGYSKYLWGKQGVITWDAPLLLSGEIPSDFLIQLKAIGEAAEKSR